MSIRELPELMLTVPETAQVLKVSTSKAKKLIAAGTVPSVTIGRCRRVRLSDLEEHIRNLPVTAAS